MSNNITLDGWKEFEGKLAHLPSDLLEEVDAECEDAAALWEELAKRDTNSTQIRVNITHERVGGKKMQWEVTSPIFFSPYVEWGTGDRAIVPGYLEGYAAQWWTHKVHVGRFPNPFFFVQIPLVEEFLFSNVRTILETAH